MWHNEALLHLVPRLTICAAYTNLIDMDNTTFYCCLCSAFICRLSWLLWLMTNNAMVKNPFLRWCNCKPNSIISSDNVIMRRVRVGTRCTAWGTLCTMVRWRGELCVHIPKSAFDLTHLTGTEITNLWVVKSRSVRQNMEAHGLTVYKTSHRTGYSTLSKTVV